MQEFLWEVWTGKRNMHHRIQVDLNEAPESAFRRLAQELQGTEKEIAMRGTDPNTGKEVDIKWKYSWRNKGEETPLAARQALAVQGVQEGALLVVRPVELRANTIYIDGFDGLAADEMAVASSRAPLIGFVLALVVLLGGGGYYFFVFAPSQKVYATYPITINTKPKGAMFTIWMDVKGLPGFGKKERVQVSQKTPRKFSIRRMATVFRVIIEKEGFKTWEKGVKSRSDWERMTKSQRKDAGIDPKLMTAKGFFPDKLEPKPKEPPKPAAVAPSNPKALKVSYPRRRWRAPRRFRLAIDPAHGGSKDPGAVGVTTQKTASALNLAIAKTIRAKIARKRAFRRKIGLTRRRDRAGSLRKRLRTLRRSRLLLQIDLGDGLQEKPRGVQKVKEGDKEITFNDAVGGYTVYYSEKNRAAKKSKKFATCLGRTMRLAGFSPKASAKDTLKAATNGVKTGSFPLLDKARIPAVRLVPGYLTHRGEEKVLVDPKNYAHIASAVENAMICYLSK